METVTVRVWWLYGPPCVGKSATAWELYDQLMSGRPRAYFDVDQVGMCYPEPPDDAGRFLLKARAAGTLAHDLVAAGAQTVVVSGVLRPGSQHQVAEAHEGAVVFCRLRADPDQLRRRLETRYGPQEVARVLAQAREGDKDSSDAPVVDTSERSPLTVARLALDVLDATTPAAAEPARRPSAPSVFSVPGHAVLICGPAAVGKSTLGFRLFDRLVGTGHTSAYLDLQQLSFLADVRLENTSPDAAGHRVTARCVADLWAQYRAVGAETLVITGRVERGEDIERYQEALGETPLVVCRLRAGGEWLRQRILDRSRGIGPSLAGDPLVNLSAQDVGPVLQRALAEQDGLEQELAANVVLDVDGLEPKAAAQRLAERLDRFGIEA